MTYSVEDIKSIYNLPITTLFFRAQEAHQKFQDPAGIQLSQLLSIKTGGCGEDCKYCPQSAKNKDPIEVEKLMDTESILIKAKEAKATGATRFCMGAAWSKVPEGPRFESVLETVSAVKDLGLEACCTLGMMTLDQAKRLKDAGCTIYNHNLDTSPEYYREIITTRTYEERLETLANVREAGLEVCCGGIIGMGEKIDDRLKLLQQLANMNPPPDAVPINALIAVKGTPLENIEFIDSFEFVRIVATTRILMPKAMIRLSAGRTKMSEETQALCFIAGANSIFLGDKLLTTPSPNKNNDLELLEKLGLYPLDPDRAREIHDKAG